MYVSDLPRCLNAFGLYVSGGLRSHTTHIERSGDTGHRRATVSSDTDIPHTRIGLNTQRLDYPRARGCDIPNATDTADAINCNDKRIEAPRDVPPRAFSPARILD